LPEHTSTRRTAPAATVESPISGRNSPVVNSSTFDTAALLRSIDFGVKTISGLCAGLSACQRSRWKYDEGSEGIAIVMLFCAHICR
jgi:hypothetical protein